LIKQYEVPIFILEIRQISYWSRNEGANFRLKLKKNVTWFC